MLKFICYPKCTTCQKAKKWLDDNKKEYELRDIKLDKPTLEELTMWHKKSGLPLRKFFNTSGLLYKSMDLKNKIPEMTEDEQKASEKAVQDLTDKYIKEIDVITAAKEKEIMEI